MHNGEIAHILPTVHVPPTMHAALRGLGEARLSDAEIASLASQIAQSTKNSSGMSVAGVEDTFKVIPNGDDRLAVARAAIAAGGNAESINRSLEWANTSSPPTSGTTRTAAFKIPTWWIAISTVSMAASAYHGYKRNRSIGWALLWGLTGATFPVITPTIALAQGFGKRK